MVNFFPLLHRFPANTTIMISLGEVLKDPIRFPEPERFKPERFLSTSSETGKVVFVPDPSLIIFGVGKRECPGKSLAKIEMFLFISGLLHQFSFYPSEHHKLPGLDEADYGVTRVPRPFHAKVVPR